MQREGELAGIFTVLLFGVIWPTGCNRGYNYGTCSSPYRRIVDSPPALARALEDDVLSDAECVMLCGNSRPYTPTPPPPEPTSSTTADPCTDQSTSTTTDTGTSGTDTGADTSTSASTDTSTSTSANTDTGTGTSTSADTSACMPGTNTTSSAVMDEDYEPGDLHTCSPIEGSLDSLTCYFIDCAFGRRPAGLRSEGRALASDPLGRLFAESAHLEAASVPAFERLAAALTAHGAPTSLRERALAAAADERRHAAHMEALAAEFGGTPSAPELDPVRMPSIVELAHDNAVQGCVGETWAALVARHQADTATLPHVRAVMKEIGADETEHAELAWAIDAWLRTRLSPAEQTEVTAARTEACDLLYQRLGAANDHPARDMAGLPRRATALTLHEGLRRALWSPSLPTSVAIA